MKDHRPSATARRVAMRRAAHQVLDHPRVFDDPLAIRMLDAESRAALETDPLQLEGGARAMFLRAYLVARSRLAEDELARAVERGVRQYVILGAGLDTFAYRNPYSEIGLRVFEVDHPATQAWKQERLRAEAIAIPTSLTFAPTHFERQSIADGLRTAGFRDDQPSFFSWLGVTMYLTHEAFRATARFVASLPAGSGIVFDYTLDPVLLDASERAAFEAMAERVRAAGEPWIGCYAPPALAAELRDFGFQRTHDFGPEDLNARYFDQRADDLRVRSLAHIMLAET
jgi:methyltransferase (TIGR00027 family)